MSGARILNGDIVYIKATPEVRNGEIAAVLIGDEATLKRVFFSSDPDEIPPGSPGKSRKQNCITLMPENPAYQPLVYRGKEAENVRILGKAVSFLSRVR